MLIEKPVGAEHFDELFAVSPELTQSEAGGDGRWNDDFDSNYYCIKSKMMSLKTRLKHESSFFEEVPMISVLYKALFAVLFSFCVSCYVKIVP